MFEFLWKLFDTSDFPPRWHCGDWTAGHGWLHIISDLGTWAAYTAIPCVLAYYVLRKRDVAFPRIFWLFCVFIFACGTVHLVEAVIFWWPIYRVSGVVKLVTAVASWATVIAMIRIAPQALALPGLAVVNRRLEAEIAERQRAEGRFRQAVESSPTAMLMVDQRGHIGLVNSQAERLFGYGRQELLGQPVDMLVPPRYRDGHPALRMDFFARLETRPMGSGRHLFAARKDGSDVPVEVGLNPIATEEGPMVLATVVDLTQRKEAERALRRANRSLQRQNREMEEFTYTVSHDLKSPLVTTMGFVGMLREDIQEGRTDQVFTALERIENATGRMSELIDDLLQLSRAGRIHKSVVEVDVSALVRDIQRDLGNQIERSDARLTIESDMPHVFADRARLREVFENLLSNALKYGAGEGPPQIAVGCRRVEREIHFFVRDNGPGIAREYHDKIFGLFQRLDTTREGTGVGLAIVAKIMESHGGRVWVESALGEGAAFWISLPAAPTAGDGA